jgi:hypothetical protein
VPDLDLTFAKVVVSGVSGEPEGIVVVEELEDIEGREDLAFLAFPWMRRSKS